MYAIRQVNKYEFLIIIKKSERKKENYNGMQEKKEAQHRWSVVT